MESTQETSKQVSTQKSAWNLITCYVRDSLKKQIALPVRRVCCLKQSYISKLS